MGTGTLVHSLGSMNLSPMIPKELFCSSLTYNLFESKEMKGVSVKLFYS